MRRLFCPSGNISREKIIINDKKQIHHIKDVLRLKQGEKIAVFDEKANTYFGVIEKFLPQNLIIKIKQKPGAKPFDFAQGSVLSFCRRTKPSQERIKLNVACAIPKRSKMEDIVDKLTQLGVEEIIPMQTERVIVKLDSAKEKTRLERWKKVALNAVEQCQGSALPVIRTIKSIADVVAQSQGYDLKLIPALIGKRTTMGNILSKTKPKNILILIGPEGDFTQSELDSAIRAGFIPVSLGERVLRVETAAVAVAAFIRLYEDL